MVGHPFLNELGKAVYQYDLKRERKFSPDLSEFKIKYDKRNPLDNRTIITEVDN